jgi:23S rRNA pseudouridine2605 synthase
VHDPETPVRMEVDRVEVDGSPLKKRTNLYLAMNKPRGVVTTASDEKGRATVYDLLDKRGSWVAPVGRLDKASEGLLLLTNDSEWAAMITDPASHLDKTYHVQIDRVSNDDLLAKIMQCRSANGEHLKAKAARLLRVGEKNSWLEIVLDEGKNRQIRRLFESLGIGVLRLVRVSIGPLELGVLKKGEVRPLTEKEKAAVDRRI